jgi:hypothetical protein
MDLDLKIETLIYKYMWCSISGLFGKLNEGVNDSSFIIVECEREESSHTYKQHRGYERT